MDGSSYLLGLATLPVAALVAVTALKAFGALRRAANRRGFTAELRFNRLYEGVHAYTLRNGIWFESPRGPIFIGHWYRADPTLPSTIAHPGLGSGDGTGVPRVHVTRWVGIGRPDGPCLVFFQRRTLPAGAEAPRRIELLPATTAA